MRNDQRLRQRLRLRHSVVTALTFGGLGVVTGTAVCLSVLLVGQTFKSEPAAANRVQATVSLPQRVCAGGSVSLEATGGDAYRWTPESGLDDPSAASPTASPKTTTEYRATVYKRTGWPLRQSGYMPVTAALLTSRDKTLYRATADVKTHQTYLLTFQARTAAYLDKATVQIRVNGKAVGTCELTNRFGRPLNIVWTNKDATTADLTLHLLSYDGDGERVECNAFDFQAVDQTTLATRVTVDRACETCPAPAKPSVVNVDMRSVKLQWTKLDNPVIVRYKRVDEESWKTVAGKGRGVTLTNLSALYDYEAQAATVCKKDTSAWTPKVMLFSDDRQMTAGR